jgi:lipoprotein-anchoring transpeptidase ErfK/SrfK
VDIGDQTIAAYDGRTLLKRAIVSTGVASHPTIVGRFAIYQKLMSQTMTGGNRFSGDYYFLPGVPNVMYFYDGYAIHGTYWHHNFGHPMSHGCVNLTIDDAKWFYDWAEIGTPVISHP